MKSVVRILKTDGVLFPKSAFIVSASVLNQVLVWGKDMKESFITSCTKYNQELLNDNVSCKDCAIALDFIIKNNLFKVVEVPFNVNNLNEYFKEHEDVC